MGLKHVFVSILVFLQGIAWASAPKEKSYNEQEDWKNLQQRMPESHRLTTNNLPQESYWTWQNYQVHIDAYPQAQAKAKVER